MEQRGYRAYPLVDDVPDKVAATYERHGAEQVPSTRYRDVVDLVSIVTGASVSAGKQRAALESEFRRRGLTLPPSFDVPDRSFWEPGYAAEARRSLLVVGRTLDEALAIVCPFLDPLLERAAAGSWNPGGPCLDRVAASSQNESAAYPSVIPTGGVSHVPERRRVRRG